MLACIIFCLLVEVNLVESSEYVNLTVILNQVVLNENTTFMSVTSDGMIAIAFRRGGHLGAS